MTFLSDLKQRRDSEQLEQEFIAELKQKPMSRDQFSIVEHILWKDRNGNIKKTGDGHKVRFLDWSRERGYEDWQKKEIRKRELGYRSARVDTQILMRQIDGKE